MGDEAADFGVADFIARVWAIFSAVVDVSCFDEIFLSFDHFFPFIMSFFPGQFHTPHILHMFCHAIALLAPLIHFVDFWLFDFCF